MVLEPPVPPMGLIAGFLLTRALFDIALPFRLTPRRPREQKQKMRQYISLSAPDAERRASNTTKQVPLQ
jgi:hypothetical protein